MRLTIQGKSSDFFCPLFDMFPAILQIDFDLQQKKINNQKIKYIKSCCTVSAGHVEVQIAQMFIWYTGKC
jgi:hypothetical protein